MLEKLAEYVETVTPAVTPIIGRENFDRLDTGTTDYCFVDALAPARAIARPYRYDGDTETEQFVIRKQGVATLNFVGPNARQNASNFQIFQKSQAGYEAQRDIEITVFHVENATNLKNLHGSQYFDNFELELSVEYNEIGTADTLRIDEAQLEFLFNE